MKDIRLEIGRIILQKKTPFKISELYVDMENAGYFDKTLIIDVLNQLYESGLVNPVDVVDDVMVYESKKTVLA